MLVHLYRSIGSVLATALKGDGTIGSMKFCVSLFPYLDGEFPEGSDDRSHPMVRGAVLTGLPDPVVCVNGSSPFFGDATSEELVPSDFALQLECSC